MAVDLCFSDRLMDADEARATLIGAAQPLTAVENVTLADAAGRVLAEDARSPLDVPGYDNSAMDGYAVRTADFADAGATLRVAQRIPAGQTGVALAAGTAARIFTGAPVPPQADAVVMQEECAAEDGKVSIARRVRPGENIRPRANDVKTGETVLTAGTLLSPQAVGLLASLGIASVPVRRQLRVAVFSTGDEIIEPGETLAPGQIYNSNRYTLISALQRAGCEVLDLGRVEDTFDATRAALIDASGKADLILTSGGVSVGEEDHIRNAVESEGRINLWRVRMKPGKPLAFGLVRETPFIGLPGNPVSAFVTFCLFAMPFIRRAQGRADSFPTGRLVQLGQDWPKARPRREYIRVRLRPGADGQAVAEAFPRQGSDVLTSTVWADGVLEVLEEQMFTADATLRFWSFDELLA